MPMTKYTPHKNMPSVQTGENFNVLYNWLLQLHTLTGTYGTPMFSHIHSRIQFRY